MLKSKNIILSPGTHWSPFSSKLKDASQNPRPMKSLCRISCEERVPVFPVGPDWVQRHCPCRICVLYIINKMKVDTEQSKSSKKTNKLFSPKFLPPSMRNYVSCKVFSLDRFESNTHYLSFSKHLINPTRSHMAHSFPNLTPVSWIRCFVGKIVLWCRWRGLRMDTELFRHLVTAENVKENQNPNDTQALICNPALDT